MSHDGLRAGPLAWGLAAFAAIFVLVGLDLLSDYRGGIAPVHLAVELSVMALSAAGVLYLLVLLRETRATAIGLAADARAAREEAQRWRAEAEELLSRLSQAIERQFKRWDLTDAERHIALGLLKGRSLRDIAAERHTSERTVRQQARAIYRKSGLTGRPELAAFFLDGLPES